MIVNVVVGVLIVSAIFFVILAIWAYRAMREDVDGEVDIERRKAG